jgi:hypothetical protein
MTQPIKLKYILWLSLSSIILSSSLLLTDGYRAISYLFLGIGLSLLIIRTILIQKIVKKTKHKVPSVFLLLFVLSTLMSALYNNVDIELFVITLSLYIIWIIINRFIADINKMDLMKYLLNISLITHIPLFLTGIFMNDFRFFSYQGFFYNPNAMGTIAATLYCSVMSILIVKIKDRNILYNNIFSFALLSFLLFFIIISSSRTSFIAALGISFFLILYDAKSGFKSIFGFFILFCVLFVLYEYTTIGQIVNDSIINKFKARVDEGNLMSNRQDMWRQTIDEMRLLGYGRTYFADMGGHNTFISILGQNGILAVIFYFLFWISTLKITFLYIRSNNLKPFNYFPFCLILSFLIMSMAEGMNGKLSMFLSFMAFAAINRID